jgi:SMC interacting uncharacterized protein involved in chromosome segregation
MKVSKSMLAAGAVTTFAVASLAGLGAVSAHGSNGSRTNENNNNVQKMEQRQEQRTERLQTLVDSGTLSEDQRAALEAKHEEMHALRDELKTQDLSREEMRERMHEKRDEFKNWAEEQGINLDELRPEGGENRGHMSRKNNQ